MHRHIFNPLSEELWSNLRKTKCTYRNKTEGRFCSSEIQDAWGLNVMIRQEKKRIQCTDPTNTTMLCLHWSTFQMAAQAPANQKPSSIKEMWMCECSVKTELIRWLTTRHLLVTMSITKIMMDRTYSQTTHLSLWQSTARRWSIFQTSGECFGSSLPFSEPVHWINKASQQRLYCTKWGVLKSVDTF